MYIIAFVTLVNKVIKKKKKIVYSISVKGWLMKSVRCHLQVRINVLAVEPSHFVKDGPKLGSFVDINLASLL
jgi:hypothetical protein